MVTINAERTFAGAGNKIHLSTNKVLLHAAVGGLSKSKKLRDWVYLNVVHLPPFLTEVVVLKGETVAGELLETFSANIGEHRLEPPTKESDVNSASGSYK